jgi:acetyltransferase
MTLNQNLLQKTDPSQNFIARYPRSLDLLFHPKSVAVIGAKDTPGSVANTILTNLIKHFRGQIYPVNPKREQVSGLTSYANIASIPEQVDLVVIVTPAATVPKIIRECVEARAKSAIIISAGFKELGSSGLKLEEEILSIAKKGNLPFIGPNCLGVMNPMHGLNATFAKEMAIPGHIAFISQSGAMCTAVLDWSFKENIGFSSFVSVGSMADVNWGTLIDYLGNDPNTHSLLLYMETIGDARAFMSAAREVALKKPIIVIKPGRSQAAAQAAASHTGSLAGSDEVFDAALDRVGVLRVNSIGELFSMASILSKQPLPKGPRLTIVTNAGGPAVLATDAAIINGAELSPLTQDTIQSLNTFLPSAWSHANPVDLLGDADSQRYSQAIKVVSNDPTTDGLLVILSPQDMTNATQIAEELSKENISKPILASWMGGESVREGAEILSEAKIPVFHYPDDASKAFGMMWHHSRHLKNLYETTVLDPESKNVESTQANEIIKKALLEGRTLLNEFESKELLHCYHIPIVETVIAHDKDSAITHARRLGYPIVLKLFSETITHKTDVGGVKLNLRNEEQVKIAFDEILESVSRLAGASHFQGVTVQPMISLQSGYELILGSTTDPQFGPILLFGTGGQLVEVFKDKALAIPPLTQNLARDLMEKTKIYEALKGVRGRKAVDLKLLESLIVNFSQLIVENPRIKECDINPLFISETQTLALDARIVLHEATIPDSELPRLAIRPYPLNYLSSFTLLDGTSILVRPIRPEDESLVIQFHKELSEDTVRQRYFEFVSLDNRTAHERLLRICFNDYDREIALVAEIGSEIGAEKRGKIKPQRQIIAIGRIVKIPGTAVAQLTLTIIDSFQHLGLGSELLHQLIVVAKNEGVEIIDATILGENTGMLKICERAGFELKTGIDPFIVHARLNLKGCE